MRVLFGTKRDLTYDILGIRSTELNMVGNKNDGPPLHKVTLNTLLEQVVGGVSIDWTTVDKLKPERRRVRPTSRKNVV